MLYFVLFDRKIVTRDLYDTYVQDMDYDFEEFIEEAEWGNRVRGVKIYTEGAFESAFNCGEIDPKRYSLRTWKT